MAGPLDGVRVVELAGLGPAPFGAMVLADLGADVITVDRAASAIGRGAVDRGRQRLRPGSTLDRRRPQVARRASRSCAAWPTRADVFVEGFRPGRGRAAGPRARRPARPQPAARLRPHDRLGPGRAAWRPRPATTSTTSPWPGRWPTSVGSASRRRVPLNLVGDFGGGGLLLALGVCAALVERAASGEGQVIDAAMVDGAALLSAAMAPAYTGGLLLRGAGHQPARLGRAVLRLLRDRRRRVAVDRRARAAVLRRPARPASAWPTATAWPGGVVPDRDDQATWPVLRERFTAVIAGRSLDEWLDVFDAARRLRGPGAAVLGGAGRPAPRGPGHLGRRRRRRAARAGAPLRPHAGRARPAAGAGRSPHRRGAGRGRLHRRRDRRPRAPASADRLTASDDPTRTAMSTQRTAVITGSASGIGAAIRARLEADGWRVDRHRPPDRARRSRPTCRRPTVGPPPSPACSTAPTAASTRWCRAPGSARRSPTGPADRVGQLLRGHGGARRAVRRRCRPVTRRRPC